MDEEKVRCWSIWQPYADGCVAGNKRVETRGRNVNIRGVVYIHATQFVRLPKVVYKRIYDELYHDDRFNGSPLYYTCFEIGTFGAILGSVEIVDCVPIEQLYGTEYDTPLERAYGDWSRGRYGIILSKPKRLKKPVQAKGHQGFWYADKCDVEEDEAND